MGESWRVGQTRLCQHDFSGKRRKSPRTGLIHIKADFLTRFPNYLEQKKYPDTDSYPAYIPTYRPNFK